MTAAGSALLEWIDEEDQERAQAVHLIDRSDRGLAVRASIPLNAGWPVLLTQADGAPIKAVVRHRRRDPGGWSLGLQVIRSERRRFDRRPLDCQMSVVWQGPDGTRRQAAGRVRDTGEGGLRFVCKGDIPFRASVLLAIDGWQRFATIVHSQPDGEQSMYGAQFSGPPMMLQSADFDD